MHANKFLLVLAVLIAGCATTEPTVRIVTQRVEVPVAVACKEETPAVPQYCFTSLTESSDIFDKVKCLLSDRELSAGYQIELAAKLQACK